MSFKHLILNQRRPVQRIGQIILELEWGKEEN